MARQVVIVHGWSDTSGSFGPLVDFLRQHGFNAVLLWLSDYISLEDDVRIEDTAKRMEQVIREKIANDDLDESFDMIVHSTGGLVARHWLSVHYPSGRNCPVRRLVMLAPANFGSKLASMGQSMLGRVVKGWNNWFHTGKEMLTGLELGSRFQWDLAQRDLFVPPDQTEAPSPYGTPGVLPFVIVGTHPYTSQLRQIVNENGADGTVRVPAANLNVRGITVDFAADEIDPKLTPWRTRHDDLLFPLAVLPDRTHGSIITPDDNEVKSAPASQEQLGKLILQALKCERLAEYRKIHKEWADISEETASLALDEAKRDAVIPKKKVLGLFSQGGAAAEYFHQYMQVVVWVVDDHGVDVPDYFLEFFGPETRSNAEAVYFHKEVLEDVHPNGPRRCFYVDRTDLVNKYYGLIPEGQAKVLAMSLSVNPPGDNVSYFSSSRIGASGHLVVHKEEDKGRWLQRNTTHFVKIIIPRTPKEGVFKLTKA